MEILQKIFTRPVSRPETHKKGEKKDSDPKEIKGYGSGSLIKPPPGRRGVGVPGWDTCCLAMYPTR
jgi:hypothetical protein